MKEREGLRVDFAARQSQIVHEPDERHIEHLSTWIDKFRTYYFENLYRQFRQGRVQTALTIL